MLDALAATTGNPYVRDEYRRNMAVLANAQASTEEGPWREVDQMLKDYGEGIAQGLPRGPEWAVEMPMERGARAAGRVVMEGLNAAGLALGSGPGQSHGGLPGISPTESGRRTDFKFGKNQRPSREAQMTRQMFEKAMGEGVSDAEANAFRMDRGDFSRTRGAEMSERQFERAGGDKYSGERLGKLLTAFADKLDEMNRIAGTSPEAETLKDLVEGRRLPKVPERIPIKDLNTAREIPIEQGHDIPVNPYEKQNAPPSLGQKNFRMLEEMLGRAPTERDVAEFMRGRFKENQPHPPSDREQRLAGKSPISDEMLDLYRASRGDFSGGLPESQQPKPVMDQREFERAGGEQWTTFPPTPGLFRFDPEMKNPIHGGKGVYVQDADTLPKVGEEAETLRDLMDGKQINPRGPVSGMFFRNPDDTRGVNPSLFGSGVIEFGSQSHKDLEGAFQQGGWKAVLPHARNLLKTAEELFGKSEPTDIMQRLVDEVELRIKHDQRLQEGN
jgi:hypothetical protein